MKKLLSVITLVALLVTTNAEAVSLRFKFKTFSSGANIYACNAGIAASASNRKVCYFEGTKTACTQTDCTAGQSCNTRCICSGGNGGNWLMDYSRAEIAPWVDTGSAPTSAWIRRTISATSGSRVFTQLHPDNEAWGNTIRELSFNLGSELYGSSYFVDICYRGPQIEYFEDGVRANFSFRAQASATDFLANSVNSGDNSRAGLELTVPSNLRYTELSGLRVQSFVTCDTQGLGNFIFARNDQGVYNSSRNEANFNINNTTGLPIAGGDFFQSSSQTNVAANAVTLLNGWITQNSSRTPRFCRIRYVFTETNINATSPNLRQWQRHGAEMCTYTDIEEAAVVGGGLE